MISNERPGQYGRKPYGFQNYNEPPRQPVAEDTLHTQEISIDRKNFRLTLKENIRGRFLRIIENNGDRHESILIPASGLEDFYAVFVQMVEADADFLPATNTEPEPEQMPPA